jgi:hypothetical protein
MVEEYILDQVFAWHEPLDHVVENGNLLLFDNVQPPFRGARRYSFES